MICKKCGRQISDDVVFCNYCGEPVNAERDTEETVRKNTETMAELSLEMRRISDKMIASYVACVKNTEVAYKQLADEYSAKIAELNKVIEKKDRAFENAKNQISVLNYKIDELSQDYIALKEENNSLKAANDKLKSLAGEASGNHVQPEEGRPPMKGPVMHTNTEKLKICDNCGAELEADALFCGKCGKRQGADSFKK